MLSVAALWAATPAAALVAGPVPIAAGPTAHEIPADVLVRAFVKPEGSRLMLLVRVPLEAMRDIEFPTTGPGYLDIAASAAPIRDAAELWISDYVVLYEDGEPLPAGQIVGARVSLPSDRSFGTYEEALAHLRGTPLPASTEIPWQQAMLDVLFEYPIASDRAEFAIDPGLAHLGLRTVTVLRFVPPGGAERLYQYTGNPGLVRLDPRWYQAAFRFVALGFEHILDGIDHLLFLLCLVVPFRSLRGLIPIVTSFTVAHSITLIASALGLAPSALWFPPLIETLIALSIVYMALENIVGAGQNRRWIIAFGFGLVHGFGFSFALRETLQFAGGHLLTSLLAFNLGVELGQLFVLVLMIPVLELLFRRAVQERLGIILISALLAHTGWHWMTERWTQLVQYDVRWPGLNLLFLAALMRWLMMGLILVGVMWVLHGLYRRFTVVPAKPESESGREGEIGERPGSGRGRPAFP